MLTSKRRTASTSNSNRTAKQTSFTDKFLCYSKRLEKQPNEREGKKIDRKGEMKGVGNWISLICGGSTGVIQSWWGAARLAGDLFPFRLPAVKYTWRATRTLQCGFCVYLFLSCFSFLCLIFLLPSGLYQARLPCSRNVGKREDLQSKFHRQNTNI